MLNDKMLHTEVPSAWSSYNFRILCRLRLTQACFEHISLFHASNLFIFGSQVISFFFVSNLFI